MTVEAHDDDLGDALKDVNVGEYVVDQVDRIVPVALELRVVVV